MDAHQSGAERGKRGFKKNTGAVGGAEKKIRGESEKKTLGKSVEAREEKGTIKRTVIEHL